MEKYSIIGSIKRINHYLNNELNSDLAGINLTRTQVDILVFIKKKNMKKIEVNQVDIEREFYLKNPTVTGILMRLEKKGYIVRKNSKKDKRYKIITLTDEGMKFLDSGEDKAKKRKEKMLNCLSKNEKEELKEILNKIIINFGEEKNIC